MTAPVPAATDEQSPALADTPAEAPLAEAPIAETPVADAVVVAIPDRADAPVSEVVERFLRAVVATVPIELIEELHLFSPLRQGTVETGSAVLAARVPIALAEESGEPELPFAAVAAESTDVLVVDDNSVVAVAASEIMDAAEDGDVVAAEGDDDAAVAITDEPAAADAAFDEADMIVAPVSEASPVQVDRPVRHTVYTARYRYVIKGPERGKWESNIKAEADAPLITVETVVRGVQRRAGEESEIVRFSGAQIARALRLPLTA